MKTAFQFHAHLAFGGEILAQPATFLPGESAENSVVEGNFMPVLKQLPLFGRFDRLNSTRNTMAQAMLNGGCNEMR
jgi:hypothetical protein